jgi:hypothetical protein
MLHIGCAMFGGVIGRYILLRDGVKVRSIDESGEALAACCIQYVS